MAYWQRTKKGGKLKVYNSRGEYIPKRGVYDHLEHEPDHNVDFWVRDWEIRTGDGRQAEPAPPIDSLWADLIEDYCQDLRQRSKGRRARGTARDHRKALTARVLPFFLNSRRLSNPNDWPKAASDMLRWLESQKCTPDNILKANSALAGFWDYLKIKQKVLQGLGISTRSPALEDKETPLPRLITPEEVLQYVRSLDHLIVPNLRKTLPIETLRRDLKLMALLGYFFSLRPQETFALRRMDFVAGSGAAELLACQVMASNHLLSSQDAKLYGRLGVHVHRQREQEGKFKTPKAYSVGWVACFNESGARLTVELLMQFERESLFFPFKPDRQYKWWKRYGIGAERAEDSLKKGTPKIVLKDLRRSSLLWMGHFTSLNLASLKGHSRHKKEEMVLRYLRRPGEKPDQGDVLDLDA